MMVFERTISSMSKIRGQRILIERRRVGLTQDALASKVGVDRSYISQLENEKDINIGVRTLYSLATELGVSALYLLGETDDPLRGIEDEDEIQTIKSGKITSWGQEMLNLLTGMNEADRSILMDLARRLKSGDSPRIIGDEES